MRWYVECSDRGEWFEMAESFRTAAKAAEAGRAWAFAGKGRSWGIREGRAQSWNRLPKLPKPRAKQVQRADRA